VDATLGVALKSISACAPAQLRHEQQRRGSLVVEARNIRGSHSVPTLNATRAMARSTGLSPQGYCPTSPHARNHARTLQHARASRSSKTGGAAISALSVRKQNLPAKQFRCDWAAPQAQIPAVVRVSRPPQNCWGSYKPLGTTCPASKSNPPRSTNSGPS